MASSEVVLAIDISSSGVRARAHARDMRVLAERAVDLTTRVAPDGSSAHNLPEILTALRAVIRPLAGESSLLIRAIGLSGTASSLALSDLKNLLSDSTSEIMLWSDTRAAATFSQIAEHLTLAYDRTLCPPDVTYWPAKLQFLSSRGGIPGSASIAGGKDLVYFWLTGRLWTDPMSAGSTGIFDSLNWRWDEDLLRIAHVSAGRLPEVRAAADSAPLSQPAAAELHLPLGLPVAIGGMDGMLTQLGSAGTEKDVASCTIGTSIAFREGSSRRAGDTRRRTWCYPVTRDFWVIGGAGSNGGNLVTWLRDQLSLAKTIQEIVDLAFNASPDPSLIFVPYLHSERAPLWRSDLRAAFIGLSAYHSAGDLSRSVLESIASLLLELAETVESVAGVPRQVVFTGRFLQEKRWVQLMTDALGVETSEAVPDVATSTGAAMAAWAAVEQVSIGDVFSPRRDFLAKPDPQVHERVRLTAGRIASYRRALWP